MCSRLLPVLAAFLGTIYRLSVSLSYREAQKWTSVYFRY